LVVGGVALAVELSGGLVVQAVLVVVGGLMGVLGEGASAELFVDGVGVVVAVDGVGFVGVVEDGGWCEV
jgi:hypothetical protein